MQLTVNVCLNMSSEITFSDTVLGEPEAKKRRRSSLEENSNSPTSNDVHHNNVTCTYTMSNKPPEYDSVERPLVSRGLAADSKLVVHDADLSPSKDIHKEIHDVIDSNHDKNDRRDNSIMMDADFIPEINVNSISEVTEHEDQVDTNSVSKEINSPSSCRSRCNTFTRIQKEFNSMDSKDGACFSVETLENKTTLLNGLGGEISSDSLKYSLTSESDAGHATLSKFEEDVLEEMGLGGSSEIKHAWNNRRSGAEVNNSEDIENNFAISSSVPYSSKEDCEKLNKAKLNGDQDVSCAAHSADKLLEESTEFCEGQISSNDLIGQDPLNDPLDQKRQINMKDAGSSSADLDEIVDDNMVNRNKETFRPLTGIALHGYSRRKLLVLDVNGLLADVVPYVPDNCNADKIIGMKAVFKRPFCDDFLKFCFERFNVGIWSSRTKKNVDLVVDCLIGNSRSNLLFCWDQSHCTVTGFSTLENSQKPLVLKELSKLWEKHDPDLPWEIGDYSKSNTLLLDDSPYKALRNPPNTAVFPNTYQYKDEKDNSLGPGGDLRVYLEGLALTDDVQKYVEQNPYGQRPITESNSSWGFYAKVMGTKISEPEDVTQHLNFEHANRKVDNRIRVESSKTTANGESFAKDRPENFEQSRPAKQSINHNQEFNSYSLGQRFEEGRRFSRVDKSFHDACVQNPPSEPLQQDKESKMKDPISPLSKVDSINCHSTQVWNQKVHQPHTPHTYVGRNLMAPKKKLLVLDVNGLLLDVLAYEPPGYKADGILGDKCVFKRPFCDDFLLFCFERFRVGFWLTTSKKNVQYNLDFLLGRSMRNLLFIWDISHCFETDFCTVENMDKSIILKELRKLWEKHESNLPWRRGEFDESNTLLLDNHPHTALLNPPHTAIFPRKYRFKDEKDDSLGPGGDLRVYLEGLASAENVQDYVKNNPFGERPITERNPSWNYYLKVIESASFHLEEARQRWWNNYLAY